MAGKGADGRSVDRVPVATCGRRIVLGGVSARNPSATPSKRLDRLVDASGRLVDTASYVGGGSERVVGIWIRTEVENRIPVVDKVCHSRRGRVNAQHDTTCAEAGES